MKWLKFVRTFKEGISNFLRNGSLTLVTVTVLSVSLYAISVTLMFLYFANLIMVQAQDKVNISIYFKPTVEESKILEVKGKLEAYDEIKYVKYVSKDKAFEDLKSYAQKNENIQKAIDEVGENPLNSLLVVGAKNPADYGKINEAVGNSFFADDINNVNFNDNESNINRISNVIKMTKEALLVLGVVFVLIGVLITFNTVKLTIYAHKQEFEVMRLVGASNLYIRMPFVFEGVFYGLVAGLVVMILLFATAYFVSPLTQGNIPEGTSVSLFLHNFFIIFVGVFGSGILLGAVSSFIAIRKYLKI